MWHQDFRSFSFRTLSFSNERSSGFQATNIYQTRISNIEGFLWFYRLKSLYDSVCHGLLQQNKLWPTWLQCWYLGANYWLVPFSFHFPFIRMLTGKDICYFDTFLIQITGTQCRVVRYFFDTFVVSIKFALIPTSFFIFLDFRVCNF